MLVSVVVCSWGRPLLRDTLESVCRQHHQPLEIIVVNALGSSHPPLPDVQRKPGQTLRVVGGEAASSWAEAADAGLFAARGEWLCVLEDGDVYDPDFVSSMLAQTGTSPQPLLIYGYARINGESESQPRVYGLPFNRALLYSKLLFCFPAALIHRRVLDLGCRPDSSLGIYAQRDFIAQVAQHAELQQVPVTATQCSFDHYSARQPRHRRIVCESRLHAKWAGPATYHAYRAASDCQRAVAAYFRNDRRGAREGFAAVLVAYPDDPNALHGLGRIAFDQGELDKALRLVRRAIEVTPGAAEYHWTLANILHVSGRLPEAREQALFAANDALFHDAAHALLRQLPVPSPVQMQAAALVATPYVAQPAATGGAIGRLAPCPCGSGLRYKDCHGRAGGVQAVLPQPTGPKSKVQEAKRHCDAGDAERALTVLSTVASDECNDASACTDAGAMLLECGQLSDAKEWLLRALEIDPDCAAGRLLNQCAGMLHAQVFSASVYREVAAACGRIARRASTSETQDPTIHIVSTLGSVGGSERHAVNLSRVLATAMPVQLWSVSHPVSALIDDIPVSTIDVTAGHFPRSGTLVLIGQYFGVNEWFAQTAFHRVVIRNNIELAQQLLERLADFELTQKSFQLDFSYPSARFRARVGLPGHVERSMTDLALFTPQNRTAPEGNAGLVIGRHSRDERLKHHPNDPAFFRKIVRSGHRVRLMGASVIAGALARGTAELGIEIVPFATQSAQQFLAGLDCFLYRAHPHWYETGGNVVAEAMAMEIPVIVFGERLGIAEIIEHGINGFVVSTEAEVLPILAELAVNPALRAAIGARARATLVRMAAEQCERSIAFYRGRATAVPDEIFATP